MPEIAVTPKSLPLSNELKKMSFIDTIPHFKQAVALHLHRIAKAKACIGYGHQSKSLLKRIFFFSILTTVEILI